MLGKRGQPLRVYAHGPERRPYVTIGPKGDRRPMQLGRVVLLAHQPPPFPGAECCHIDGDFTNNDPSNLRWGTSKENTADSLRHGTFSPPPHWNGSQHPNAKLTEADVAEIRATYAAAGRPRRSKPGDPASQAALATKYGVSQGLISTIVRGAGWRHVDHELAPRRRLTADLIAAIQAEYRPSRGLRGVSRTGGAREGSTTWLAAKYGVSVSTISAALRR